nr:protein EARLY RESPONSIVE TO DEHYDRATION 15-like [Ipomoea batatas]
MDDFDFTSFDFDANVDDFDFSGFDFDADMDDFDFSDFDFDFSVRALKWQKPRVAAGIPKYGQKELKIVNVKGPQSLGLPPMCKDESSLELGKNRKVSMVSEVDVVGTNKADQRLKDPRIDIAFNLQSKMKMERSKDI